MNFKRKEEPRFEAYRWTGSNWHEMLGWLDWKLGRDLEVVKGSLEVRFRDSEAGFQVNKGQWVVSHDGSLTVYDDKRFHALFEEVIE